MSARHRFSRSYQYQHYDKFQNFNERYDYQQSSERLRNDRNSFTCNRSEGSHNDRVNTKSNYIQSSYSWSSPEWKERRLVREKRSAENGYFDSQPPDWSSTQRNKRLHEENLPDKTELNICKEFPYIKGNYSGSGYPGSNPLQKNIHTSTRDLECDKRKFYNFDSSRFQNPISTNHYNDVPSQCTPSQRFETGNNSRFNSKETDKYEEYYPNHGYFNVNKHFDSPEITKSCSRIHNLEIAVQNSLQYSERRIIRSPYNNFEKTYEEMDLTRLKSANQESSSSTVNQRYEEHLPDHQPEVCRPSGEDGYERRVIYKSHSDLRSPQMLSETMVSHGRYSSAQSTAVGKTLTKTTRTDHGQYFQDSYLNSSEKYETSYGHPHGAITGSGVNDLRNNFHEQAAKSNNGMYMQGSKFDLNPYEYDKKQKLIQGNHETFSVETNYGYDSGGITKSYKEESDEEDKVPLTKVNPVIPHSAIVNRFKFYPPSAEEMGEIFRGIVIYFPYSTSEESAILSITKSFKESAQFDNLQVYDTFHNEYLYVKYSTIRWHGMILARGFSETENCSVSRNVAAIELINKLAQTCFSLKENPEYFHSNSIRKLLEVEEIPGVFRLVRHEEAPNLEAAIRFIDNFFKDNNDYELMFHCNERMLFDLKRYVRRNGYQVRCITLYVFVSVRRTPQYWRDKMLARGNLQDCRYQLIPPQGIGNDIFQNFNIKLPVQENRKESKVHPLLWESLHAKRYSQQIEDHLIPLAYLATHELRVQRQQQQEENKLRVRAERIAKKQVKKLRKKQNKAPNQMKTQSQKPSQGLLESQTQMHNQTAVIGKPPRRGNIPRPPDVRKPKFKHKREYRRMYHKFGRINKAMRKGKTLLESKTFKKMDEETQKWVMYRYNVHPNQ